MAQKYVAVFFLSFSFVLFLSFFLFLFLSFFLSFQLILNFCDFLFVLRHPMYIPKKRSAISGNTLLEAILFSCKLLFRRGQKPIRSDLPSLKVYLCPVKSHVILSTSYVPLPTFNFLLSHFPPPNNDFPLMASYF